MASSRNPPMDAIDTRLLGRLLRPLDRPALLRMEVVRRIFAGVAYFEGRRWLSAQLSRRGAAASLRGAGVPVVHAIATSPTRDAAAVEAAPSRVMPSVEVPSVPRVHAVQVPGAAGQVSTVQRVLVPSAASTPRIERGVHGDDDVVVAKPAPSAGAPAIAPSSERLLRPLVRHAVAPSMPRAEAPRGIAHAVARTERVTVVREGVRDGQRGEVAVASPTRTSRPVVTPLAAPAETPGAVQAHASRGVPLVTAVAPQARVTPTVGLVHATAAGAPVAQAVDSPASSSAAPSSVGIERAVAPAPSAPGSASARPATRAAPAEERDPAPPRQVNRQPLPRVDVAELADQVQRRLLRQMAQERTRRGLRR